MEQASGKNQPTQSGHKSPGHPLQPAAVLTAAGLSVPPAAVQPAAELNAPLSAATPQAGNHDRATGPLPPGDSAVEAERRRLFALLDELPALVYLKAPDHTIRFANRQFRQRFGDPGDQLCYRLIHGRDTPCEPCITASVLRGRAPAAWEWTFADGHSYQIYDYPFFDVDGTQLVVQLGMDITRRKQAEAELERINNELLALSQAERQERLFAESLVEAMHALNSSLDLADVLDRILEQAQRATPCPAAAVMLLDGDRLCLARQRGLNGPPEAIDRLRSGIPIESAPVFRVTCRDRHPALIQDTAAAPGWQGLPGLAWVRSLAAVPLTGEAVTGLIALMSDAPGAFAPRATERLQVFATHAVLAMENARLYEEMRAGREQLQMLSRRLVTAHEDERRFIARELHDEAGQALTSLLVQLKLLQRQAGDPQVVHAQAAELIRAVEGVMDNLHRLAVDLRPVSLDHLGLVAALRQYCETTAGRHGLAITFSSDGLDERLSAEIETAVYRIVQEAVTNTVRHAQAGRVAVELRLEGSRLVASIADDGRGFDPAAGPAKQHLGLVGMRERAAMLGGRLTVQSSRSQGTTVVVEVPDVH